MHGDISPSHAIPLPVAIMQAWIIHDARLWAEEGGV